MTKVYNFMNEMDQEVINFLGREIKNGKIVIFPTETVYGIGANIFDPFAVDKIFDFKGRANDNPLIVHISDKTMLNDIVFPYSDVERKLIDAFMPGPFTIILNKRDCVNKYVTGGLNTVGVRMPSNIVARKLIKAAGVPIAAPSANLSGKPSGTNIDDVYDEFNGKVDYIIDYGDSDIGLESTVVKVIDGIPVILRPGKITPEDIIEVVGAVKVHDTVLKPADLNEKVESPGVKYKHYAPEAKTLLIYSDYCSYFKETIKNYIIPNTCIIGPEEWKNDFDCKYYVSYGSENNLSEISKKIYKSIRLADSYKPDFIIIVGVSDKGEGLAIMNRLLRASSYNFINVDKFRQNKV